MPTVVICLLSILLFWQSTDLLIQQMVPLSIAIVVWQVIVFVMDLGVRVNPLGVIKILAPVSYLFAPAMSYHFAEIELYEGFSSMAVEAKRYFDVAFPGTMALIAGLCVPFKGSNVDHKERFREIEAYLSDKQDLGIKLFWFGAVCSVASPFVPSFLSHFVVLSSLLIYIGGLYIWFSNHPMRHWYMLAVFIIPIAKSVKYGMFTELIFWGLFMLMVFLLKFQVRFHVKLLAMLLGTVLLLFIQSIKYEYRMRTWFDIEMYTMDARMSVFKELLHDRVAHPETLVSDWVLLGALERINQGSLTSMAIRYTPDYEPFAKGETIFTAFAVSFIPRAIWPDKPSIGGRESMKRFTGFEPVGNTSMDIGQLGDAYVNFGAWGGALFLFFYGLLFGFIYAKLFEYSAQVSLPALLWVPMFFTGTVQVESSVLSTFSHVFHVLIFFVIVQWGAKEVLKIKL